MLREFRVQNYAIASEVSLVFSSGLNVITGETGAGKSLLVDALWLLLGGRATGDVIRHGADEAVLEACFDPPVSPPHSADETPPDAVVLKRVLSRSGKHRAYLNGGIAALASLKAVGGPLAEIHGQQDQDNLSDLAWQLHLLDAWGGLLAPRAAHATLHHRLQQLQTERADLARRLSGERRDWLQFQWAEIQNAHLQPDEEEALIVEERLVKNREAILTTARAAYAHLAEEDAVLSRLEQVGAATRDLQVACGDAEVDLSLWETAHAHLKELADRFRRRLSDAPPDPGRLDEVAARLYLIQRLKKKYGASVHEMLESQKRRADELAEIADGAAHLDALAADIEKYEALRADAAAALSRKRSDVKTKLETMVQGELDALGMEKTGFQIVLGEKPPAEDGVDRVEFQIALPGEPSQGLARIASGGERSRIMLALKAALAQADPVPTLVFDEIDAGIGGGIAERVGMRLHRLAQNHQVFCVTHLPQIAAFATRHYVVEKQGVGDRVVATARALSDAERAPELARMLGGVTLTPITLRHAEEMLRYGQRVAHEAGDRVS